MPSNELAATQEPAGATADQHTEAVVRRLAEAHRDEAELTYLTMRLNDLPDFKRDPSGTTNAYVDGLVKRRAELLARSSRATMPRVSSDLRAQPIDSLLANVGHLFGPWTTLRLPYMSEGINETPGVAGTSGEIGTAGLFAGGLAYGGQPSDGGTQQPHTEKWWVHNWNCSVVFPEAPFTGKLYYRFTVDSVCNIYRAPAFSGLLTEFVTIGKTSDIIDHSPFDDPNIATEGWPVSVTLPQPNGTSVGGTVPIAGSIPVEKGKTAALAFIYGTVVGVADGYVMLLWANFGTRLTLPAGTSFDGEAYDKLEYRFEPTWWYEAVAERLKLKAMF